MKTIDIMAIPELYGVVYMLTNPLGERYIGSAVDLRRRMGRYRRGGHGLIGESILEYGFEYHTLSILAKNISEKNLLAREKAFQKKIQPELNLKTVNAGGLVRHAESTKKKISEAKMGQEAAPATRAKISAALKGENNPMFGKKHMPEACAKISAAKLGVKLGPVSPEHRAKLSAAMMGHEVTPETRAKISATKKGIPRSPESVAKTAEGRREYYRCKNNKRDKKIISMRKEGKTFQAISDSVGLSTGGVQHICRQHPEIEKALTAQLQKRDKRILSLREKGMPLRAIANRLGLSYSVVRQICQQAK